METGVETHTLRDVGRNLGYVRLDGDMTWSLEDWSDAALRTASSWRNEMNERNLVLCMLSYDYGPRRKPRRKNANQVQEQWYARSGRGSQGYIDRPDLFFRASGISSILKRGDATCAQRMKCRANGVYYGLSIVRFCNIFVP